MKKRMISIVLLLICTGLTACDTAANKGSQIESQKAAEDKVDPSKGSAYKNIKPREAKQRLGSEEGIILLDVRTPEEYAEKHIPNTLLIPVEVIEKEALAKLMNKDAVIFVYCRSGRRSVTASEALVKMGYTNVYNLGALMIGLMGFNQESRVFYAVRILMKKTHQRAKG